MSELYDPQQLMNSVGATAPGNQRNPNIGPGQHQLAFCHLVQRKTQDKGVWVFLTAAVVKSEYHPVGILVSQGFPLNNSKFLERELGRINQLVGACIDNSEASQVSAAGTQMLQQTFGRGYQFNSLGVDVHAGKAGKEPFYKASFGPLADAATVNTAAQIAAVSGWLDSIPGSTADMNQTAAPATPALPALAQPAALPALAQPAAVAAPAPMLAQPAAVAAPAPMLAQPAAVAAPAPMLAQPAAVAAPAVPATALPFSI